MTKNFGGRKINLSLGVYDVTKLGLNSGHQYIISLKGWFIRWCTS